MAPNDWTAEMRSHEAFQWAEQAEKEEHGVSQEDGDCF